MPQSGTTTTRFSGVWLPVITPFEDGEIDHASYERLVDHYVRAGVAGIIPLGTTGESPTIDEAESAALIEELIAFATQPHFIYAHKWRQGDILIWDNRCTLHRGTAYDYRNHKRDMRRATVNEAGEDRSAIPAGLSLQMLAGQAKAPAP